MNIYTFFHNCRFFKEQMSKYLLYCSGPFLHQVQNLIWPCIICARTMSYRHHILSWNQIHCHSLLSAFHPPQHPYLFPHRSNYEPRYRVRATLFFSVFQAFSPGWIARGAPGTCSALAHAIFLKLPSQSSAANHNHGLISPFRCFFCSFLPLPLMSA